MNPIQSISFDDYVYLYDDYVYLYDDHSKCMTRSLYNIGHYFSTH